MGLIRRTRPTFRFIRDYDANLFNNLTLSRPPKNLDLLKFSQAALRGEFYRLISLFRRQKDLKISLQQSLSSRDWVRLGRKFVIKSKRNPNKRKSIANLRGFKKKTRALRSYSNLAWLEKSSTRAVLPLQLSYFNERRGFSIPRKQDGKSQDYFLAQSVKVSRFIVRLIKVLLGDFRLRSWVLITYPWLWLGLSRAVSAQFRGILCHGGQTSSVYYTSTQRDPISKFEKFSGVSQYGVLGKSATLPFLPSKLNLSSWRVRQFFLTQLQKRYGFRTYKSVIRLDTDIKKFKRNRNGGSMTTLAGFNRTKLHILRQKIRRYYGKLTLGQLWRYRKRASTHLKGLWDRYSLSLFECRLDIMLIRAQFVKTSDEAKSLILKGLVLVNGRLVTYYRYAVGPGDLIRVRPEYLKTFQLYHLSEFWSSLTHPGRGIYKVFPSYLEISYKSFAFLYLINKFTLSRLPMLSKFNAIYAINCGRFQF